MSPRTVDDEDVLVGARWRLLAASDREPAGFLDELAPVEDALAGTGDRLWTAWSHAFAARRLLATHDAETALTEVATARELLDRCGAGAEQALLLAYLAHLEVSADRPDAAMHLAVDASLMADQVPADQPSRELHQAHRWLSLALASLDLEELAVAQALRGHRVAADLPDLGDRWQLLLLCAQQHVELAQTVRRRGDDARATRLAAVALRCTAAARELDHSPADADADLLDVLHCWALALDGDLDVALQGLRRVRRRIEPDGGLWLLGYTDLVLARTTIRLHQRETGDGAGAGSADTAGSAGAEATDLLVAAAGAFAAVGDRRRYRQCLLELGQATAVLGHSAEALHWLEAYRADATRSHLRGRELWAEMFVRRSRLREAERQTAVLRRHAMEDPLTGLGNRRSAELVLSELPFTDTTVSLAVVDVDRFKGVNDSHSHLHGDAVLRRVADLMRQHCRTGDEVYRWAGDEFVVVLPGAHEAQAVVAMERLRSAVAGSDWSELGLEDPVTVSIGVATAHPGGPGPSSWRALFDAADLHLFGAKRGGRDRVRTSTPPPVPGAPLVQRPDRGHDVPAGASVDDMVAEMLGAGAVRPPGWAFASVPDDERPDPAPDGGR